MAGLLALMLLTDARRPARTGPDGGLVPLAEQDRTRWDAATIAEGVDLITHTLRTAPIGPSRFRPRSPPSTMRPSRAELTDWPQILILYGLLERWRRGRWSR